MTFFISDFGISLLICCDDLSLFDLGNSKLVAVSRIAFACSVSPFLDRLRAS